MDGPQNDKRNLGHTLAERGDFEEAIVYFHFFRVLLPNHLKNSPLKMEIG